MSDLLLDSSAWLLQVDLDEKTSNADDGQTIPWTRSHRDRRPSFAQRYSNWFRIVVVLGVVLDNVVWYAAWRHTVHASRSTPSSMEKNQLNFFLKPGEAEAIQVPFEHDWTRLEEVEVNGYRYGDAHWQPGEWAPTNGSVVSVSRELQADLGLDLRAGPAADDQTQVLYLVSGFHALHCLHVVRDSLYYLNGTIEWPSPPFQWSHVLHCVEAVRQSVTCALDPTLIPLDSTWPGIPNGQTHTCRNRDALFRWTSEHAHDIPEFSAVTEGPHTKEWIERVGRERKME